MNYVATTYGSETEVAVSTHACPTPTQVPTVAPTLTVRAAVSAKWV